jgi:hypothetical protein
MKNNLKVIALGYFILIGAGKSFAQKSVGHFEKVTVNPNIEVVFKQGAQESVSIVHATIDKSKILIEVSHDRLNLSIKGWNDNEKHNPYSGTKASLVVTYRNIEELILKGDQEIVFEDKLSADDFTLHIYGDSEMFINEVDIASLESKIFGDNTLKIKSGSIKYMDYTVFGNCNVNTKGVDNYQTKIMSFGDAEFDIHVSNYLKVNALGEADITYSGNPKVSKGLSLGDTSIRKAR